MRHLNHRIFEQTRSGLSRWDSTGSNDFGILADWKRGNLMAEKQHSGNSGNFAEDREKAARAGQVGGQHSSGNFANDRERAAEAGRKGGQASHGTSHASGSSDSDNGGAEHRSGNFADDREKASEAGRKGGQR